MFVISVRRLLHFFINRRDTGYEFTTAVLTIRLTSQNSPALKASSLCPNPFKGFLFWSESFGGMKGVWVCRSDLLCHLSRGADVMQRIMGAGSEIFHSEGPLKWPVMSTPVWNDPSMIVNYHVWTRRRSTCGESVMRWSAVASCFQLFYYSNVSEKKNELLLQSVYGMV